jgi:hypothetical protein
MDAPQRRKSMIAQRFRSVGWVASIAVAATTLYMISLHVASERGRLEGVERKIAATKRDIRQLQTELGTRASLRQLERWNGDVLALSAPGAGQYLRGEAALASADQSALGTSNAPPPAIMVAVGTNAQAEEAAKAKAEQPVLLSMLAAPKLEPKLTAQDHAVQRALSAKAPEKLPLAKPEKAAKPEKIAMLDSRTVRDLARKATSEAGTKPKK